MGCGVDSWLTILIFVQQQQQQQQHGSCSSMHDVHRSSFHDIKHFSAWICCTRAVFILCHIMSCCENNISSRMLASFSCMVLAEMDPTVCYVKRNTPHSFEHRCGHACQRLYDVLHSDVPTEEEFFHDRRRRREQQELKVHRCDHCFGGAPMNWCGDLRQTCSGGGVAGCSFAKTSLARRWSELALQLQRNHYPGLLESEGVDVAVHLRGGDKLETLLKDVDGSGKRHGSGSAAPGATPSTLPKGSLTTLYENLDRVIFKDKSLPWTVFVEFSGESQFLSGGANFSGRVIIERAGGDPVETWLLMAFAKKALVMYSSTFSVSASVVRPFGLLSFSKEEKPSRGRYDANRFFCHAGKQTKWWWSRGHGTVADPESSDCDLPELGGRELGGRELGGREERRGSRGKQPGRQPARQPENRRERRGESEYESESEDPDLAEPPEPP